MLLSNHNHTHREIVKGKTIHVYINGDLFFEAKAIVVHKKTDRTFESLLIRLTDILNPRFGAVRHLKTADGSIEVKSLEELVSGASYVAYGQKFKALDYADISSRLKALAHPVPLLSPREFRKLVVSGRARKIVRHPLLIYVYPNGEALAPAKKVLLQPWIHKTWDNVLEQIATKVHLRRTRPITKLYELETKMQVCFGADLQDQHFYVACGNEKFKKEIEYGLSQTMFTPKQQMAKRYPTLPPIEPHEAKQKPSSSAPTEKCKRDPKPPPSKKPDDNENTEGAQAHSVDGRQKVPQKLRTPSPDHSLLEKDSHKKVPPTNSETNHRVSPIQEQKTPSSTATGIKEEEKELSFIDHQQKEEREKASDEQVVNAKKTEPAIEEEDAKSTTEAKQEPNNADMTEDTQTANSNQPASTDKLENRDGSEAADDSQPAGKTEQAATSKAEEDLYTEEQDLTREKSDMSETAGDKQEGEAAPLEDVKEDRREGDGKATEENTADNKPADDKPADDNPADNKQADDKLADVKPADDKPADDKPADDKSADDKLADDKPADNKLAGDKPADDKPTDDKPADDKLADDKPADNKPADEKRTGDKPADDKPADDKPAEDKADDKAEDETAAEDGKTADDESAENNKPAAGKEKAEEDNNADNTRPTNLPSSDNDVPPADENKEENNNNSDTSAVPQAAPVETQG